MELGSELQGFKWGGIMSVGSELQRTGSLPALHLQFGLIPQQSTALLLGLQDPGSAQHPCPSLQPQGQASSICPSPAKEEASPCSCPSRQDAAGGRWLCGSGGRGEEEEAKQSCGDECFGNSLGGLQLGSSSWTFLYQVGVS